MSATVTVPRAAHVPVQRRGPRPGSLHAALPEGTGWRTACGELLHDSARGHIAQLPLLDAWALIDSDSPLICRRCDRVGDGIAP